MLEILFPGEYWGKHNKPEICINGLDDIYFEDPNDPFMPFDTDAKTIDAQTLQGAVDKLCDAMKLLDSASDILVSIETPILLEIRRVSTQNNYMPSIAALTILMLSMLEKKTESSAYYFKPCHRYNIATTKYGEQQLIHQFLQDFLASTGETGLGWDRTLATMSEAVNMGVICEADITAINDRLDKAINDKRKGVSNKIDQLWDTQTSKSNETKGE